jgi:hypothetical protein
LDWLDGEDRKLLVFADNRQDTAHQAGYTADKHRSFALRHIVADEVRKAGEGGVYLTDLPQRIFDRYGHKDLGIIQGRPTRPQRERWLDAISYEAANEFSRFARQRASLENAKEIGLTLVRALVDTMRKSRAIGFDFFQEYIDPNRKRRYRELEADPYGVRFPDRITFGSRGPAPYSASIRKTLAPGS